MKVTFVTLCGAALTFAVAVALTSCAEGSPEALSDLRVCGAEAYDEGEEECTEDRRDEPLKSNTVYCSAKVRAGEGERVKGRLLYEGEPLPGRSLRLPADASAFSMDFYVGLGSIPGGRWACEVSLGSEKLTANFESAGPTGRLVNLAACRTAEVQADRPICPEDPSGVQPRPNDLVTCSATVVGAKDEVVDVDFLYEGRETGISLQQEIPSPVAPVYADLKREQELPEGDYACRFSLAGGEVGEEHFSIVSDDGEALAEPRLLAERVVHAGELAGVEPGDLPEIVRGADAWADFEGLSGKELARETAWLRRLGFVAGIVQFFDRDGRERQAISLAMEVSSAEAARAELSRWYANQKASTPRGERFVPFAVPGIPGARGVDRHSPGLGGGHNIGFADGPFFYLVGATYLSTELRSRIRAEVIAATTALYARVRGLPPS